VDIILAIIHRKNITFIPVIPIFWVIIAHMYFIRKIIFLSEKTSVSRQWLQIRRKYHKKKGGKFLEEIVTIAENSLE
jgi:hypothetical protein